MVLLSLTGSLCLGTVVVSVLSPVKEVGPGEFATNVFSVLNDSPASDVFHPEIEAPEGFVLLNVLPNLSLAPGESTTGTTAYTVQESDLPGPLLNVATATGTPQGGDPVSNTDFASVGFTRPIADLALEKSVDNASPYEGDDIVYTILLTNNGPDDATGVEVTDVLPPGVTYAVNNGNGTYDSVRPACGG